MLPCSAAVVASLAAATTVAHVVSAAVVASLAAATTVAHAVSAAVMATLAAARALPVHAAAVAALIAAFSFQCIYQDCRV